MNCMWSDWCVHCDESNILCTMYHNSGCSNFITEFQKQEKLCIILINLTNTLNISVKKTWRISWFLWAFEADVTELLSVGMKVKCWALSIVVYVWPASPFCIWRIFNFWLFVVWLCLSLFPSIKACFGVSLGTFSKKSFFFPYWIKCLQVNTCLLFKASG